jgi:LemA protein
MKHEERLNRMLENGIISQEQFDSLYASLETSNEIRKEELKHRKIPVWIGVAIAIINLFIAIFFIDFGGDVPQVAAQSLSAVEDITQTYNQGGVGAMDSKLSNSFSIVVFGSFILIPIFFFIWLYNGLVQEEESIHIAWSQVESNYQRRADLIPNLVESVSKYLQHEEQTLTTVTDARGGGLDDTIKALVDAQREGADLLQESNGSAPEDEAYLAMLTTTQNRIGQLMHKLVATVESYPNLKGSEHLLQLQAQLEGTENRINVARMRFNETVGAFNASIRRMPMSLVASMGNFRRKAYFKSDEGADKVNRIKFD